MSFNNDDIVARATDLAKADGWPVLWEKYIPQARKQLEIETEEARLAKAGSSPFTTEELVKADQANHDRVRPNKRFF